MTTQLQGIELVRAVIEKLRTSSFKDVFGSRRIIGNPEPKPVAVEVLEQVRLDGDLPLTPCMKEWLAFDGTLFGWVNRSGAVEGERLGGLAMERLAEVGHVFEMFERRLSRLCYALPFGDMEYLHFVYPSKPDSTGELPVLSAESENQHVLVTYPGIDAFLGHHAGLLEKGWHKRFQSRFTEHQQQTLGGEQALELGGDGDEPPQLPPEEGLPPGIQKIDATTYLLNGDGPVPAGFRVVRELPNPFTKETMRHLTKAR